MDFEITPRLLDVNGSLLENVSHFLTREHTASRLSGFIGHGSIPYDVRLYEPFRSPLFGLQRAVDTRIVSALIEKQQRLGRALNVLEVGAGGSWGGLTSHFGAPWLSRALSTLKGEEFKITISDISCISLAPQAFVLLVYYPQSQKLFVQALDGFGIGPAGASVGINVEKEGNRLKKLSTLCSLRERQQLIPLTTQQIDHDNDLKVFVPEILQLITQVRADVLTEDPLLFLRPRIDPLLESFFGINKIRYHFNMLDEACWDTLLPKDYDFIFARHQQTTKRIVVDWIESQVRSKNIPAIMHFDGDNGGYIIDTTGS